MAKRADIEAALRRLAPKIPPHEFAAVADHAVDSQAAYAKPRPKPRRGCRSSPMCGTFTEYDDLLEQGYDEDSARHFVAAEIEGAKRLGRAAPPRGPRLEIAGR